MSASHGETAVPAAGVIALAERLTPLLQSDERERALVELERSHLDFERALAWLVGEGDAEGAARLVRRLAEFWWERGHTRDGLRWAREVLALPGVAEPTETRAMLLDATAALAARDGDRAAQIAHFEEALAIRRRLGEPRPLAQSLVHLGSALLKSGERERGWALWEEALAHSRRHGLGRYARHALYQMARVAIDEGDLDTADASLREILTGLRGSPDEYAAGAIFELAGALASRRGQHERALTLRVAGEAQRLAVAMTDQGELGEWLKRMLEPTLRALDEETQATVTREGKAMTRAQAFAYALGETA